jgi:hypothetical protein
MEVAAWILNVFVLGNQGHARLKVKMNQWSERSR